jgi:hypothetical protein
MFVREKSKTVSITLAAQSVVSLESAHTARRLAKVRPNKTPADRRLTDPDGGAAIHTLTTSVTFGNETCLNCTRSLLRRELRNSLTSCAPPPPSAGTSFWTTFVILVKITNQGALPVGC